ncbi:hypothetical protein TNCV_705961 [Trichonephila clavipes]|nr:hypothetical protein TNCV_705961 [Trichonephila clavipes]
MTLLDNFKRTIMEAKHVNEFRPDDVLWEKISKGLLRNPNRPLKNTDKRMVYIYNNMCFVKKDFTFNFRTKNIKRYDQNNLQATSSYPDSCTYRDKQTTFGRRARAFFQNVSRQIQSVHHPIIRPSVAPVLIARPSTTFASPQPVIIPELQPPEQIPELTTARPPVQIPDPSVQLILPDPPQPPI